MARLLIGIGVALTGWVGALAWQVLGSAGAGWLGVVGLFAGGWLMLSPLFDAPTIVIDDEDEDYITAPYSVGEGRIEQ